ncbi:anhydro-N-acetylmuramic acid kinase [Noviherbaspirillum cavernae]|uniref:Anhydro-N-acetylmuramic acid kinase n=1 Tax=Noviherbaspirillum cavernae TaxID=2320862 RepID=A0A418X408_9BURK|nr:anhydro-N-acetylmuramic acid kinase [Noviherbaspirillum cavernae]RJG07169.1 anhydro-N-acetylmuramic acid kinase [Noviherbaspirillum cavernae]
MPMTQSISRLYIGLMSGTSLDGVDGVLAAMPADGAQSPIQTMASAYIPFPAALRRDLMSLQAVSDNELHHEALAANTLARHYAECVTQLLQQSGMQRETITAIGAHGQTIRHRPEAGYTRQTNNPALLAELTGIDVIADFRSRDIAAGGQGAPLVPAFHRAVFGKAGETRIVANIGGIGNISVLTNNEETIGFDTGPGNVLMDAWIAQHHGKTYDADGAWAASGMIVPDLLTALLNEPYFMLSPPKSTGRDLFHPAWLAKKLAGFSHAAPADVQATLAAFTATTLANAITAHASEAKSVYVCGGGAYNAYLMRQLRDALTDRNHMASVQSTEALGISPNHVEALAFAWLAQRHVERKPGNLPSVTGAKGLRILGALYPA